MNPQQQEQSEREQASRTLPPPPAPEPAPGRVAARRVHFLSEIDRQTPARSYRPMLRPGKRWGLALGTAVAAAASIAVLSLGSGSPAAPAKVPPASAASVQLLERAALVAAATPQTKARAGQYTYIKTVGHTSVLSETKTGEMALLRQDEGMEQWTSVDGSAQTLQRKNGSDTLLPGNPGQGNLNSPTYNLLDGLPTDPEALLKRISDDAEENHGAGSESTTGPHQEAFVTIGDLLRNGGTPPTPLLLSTVPLLSFPASTSSPTPWTQQAGTGSLWPGHTTANASSGSSTRAPSAFWANARCSWKTTPGVRLAPSSPPLPSSTPELSTRLGRPTKGEPFRGTALYTHALAPARSNIRTISIENSTHPTPSAP